jgi:hypothetical protein
VAVAVAVVLLIQRQVQTVATVVLELSSLVMLVLNVAQAAHTLQLAETQSTPSQQAGHTQHEHEIPRWVRYKKPSGSVIGGGVWYLVAGSGRAKHQGQHMAFGSNAANPFFANSI